MNKYLYTIIYDTSLENTLSNMKKQKRSVDVEKRDTGEIIWNGFRFEKVGGNKLEIIEKNYNISDDLQIVVANTSNILLKKLKDIDREIYKKSLESHDFENYKA